MITVVCVRAGKKYGIGYVAALARMVSENISQDYRMLCLTDQPERIDGVEFIDISEFDLHKWFAKMLVFNRRIVGTGKILFIDLDMIIIGGLDRLVDLDVSFGICRNFTRLRQGKTGSVTWPCLYSSCVMLLDDQFGDDVWEKFWLTPSQHIKNAGRLGDQAIIQWLYPAAPYLQNKLPDGYFLHYSDFTDKPDERAAILVFAGRHKPHNCEFDWIKRLWTCAA